MKTNNQPRAAGEAAHTPTPWHVIEEDNCTFSIMHTGSGQWIATVHGGREYDEQDAAFIVRACNSHAALVGALEALLRVADEHVSHKAHDTHCEVFSDARDALALAKGSQ